MYMQPKIIRKQQQNRIKSIAQYRIELRNDHALLLLRANPDTNRHAARIWGYSTSNDMQRKACLKRN